MYAYTLSELSPALGSPSSIIVIFVVAIVRYHCQISAASSGNRSFYLHFMIPRFVTCDEVCAMEPDHHVSHVASGNHSETATKQACDGVYATEPDHYVCYVAGRWLCDRLCILAIILGPCGGHATKQVDTSGGTLATIQSIHDSAVERDVVCGCYCGRRSRNQSAKQA